MATRARKTRTQGKGPRCARSCCLGDAPGRALRPVALAQRGGEVRGRRQRTPGAEHLREARGAGTRRPPDPEWGGGGGGRGRFVSAAGETRCVGSRSLSISPCPLRTPCAQPDAAQRRAANGSCGAGAPCSGCPLGRPGWGVPDGSDGGGGRRGRTSQPEHQQHSMTRQPSSGTQPPARCKGRWEIPGCPGGTETFVERVRDTAGGRSGPSRPAAGVRPRFSPRWEQLPPGRPLPLCLGRGV